MFFSYSYFNSKYYFFFENNANTSWSHGGNKYLAVQKEKGFDIYNILHLPAHWKCDSKNKPFPFKLD